MDIHVSLGEQTPPQGVSVLSTNTLQENTQHGTSFECHIIDVSKFKKYYVSKVCVRLGINRLIKTMPSQGSGIIKKPVIVFYNQFQKEIEVKHINICDLKNLKTHLENDIMNFMLSHVYLTYQESYKYEIHIVRSCVSCSIVDIMKSGSGL